MLRAEGGINRPISRRIKKKATMLHHAEQRLHGDTVMAVDVSGSGDQPAATPHALFSLPGLTGDLRPFAVTPDGQRFIAIIGTPNPTPLPATVVLHWKPAGQ